MPAVPHRITPNRAREFRERVWALVGLRLGHGLICTRCVATYRNMDERCAAKPGEPCPAEKVIDRMRATVEAELTR